MAEDQYLVIHGIDVGAGDFYCGDYLNTNGHEAITSNRASEGGTVLSILFYLVTSRIC